MKGIGFNNVDGRAPAPVRRSRTKAEQHAGKRQRQQTDRIDRQSRTEACAAHAIDQFLHSMRDRVLGNHQETCGKPDANSEPD
jgi:hypothetical protein